MKKHIKLIISYILCICISLGTIVPIQAANEDNNLGVVFTASLDKSTIYTSNQEQTVVMSIDASKGIDLIGIAGKVIWDGDFVLHSISNTDERIDYSGSVNLEKGILAWDGNSSADVLENVINIATITFTIPANTSAGTYVLGFENIELCDDEIIEGSASATTTLTIAENPATSGYTAGITSLTSETSVNNTVDINVNITHAEETVFAAGEIKVVYDSSKLEFDKNSSQLGDATIKNESGIITLEDYGPDKAVGSGVYVLRFNVIADGSCDVTLTSASFINKENAVKEDLLQATITPEKVSLQISKQTFGVRLSDIFVGASSAEAGQTYTFSKADANNYDYTSVSATMGGQSVTVIDNGDGTYTINNVTGALIITGTRTEKTYDVKFEGDAAEDFNDGTATYNTDYTFTIPETEGWSYLVDSIMINGTTYTGYAVAEKTYTIPGSDINGDIVITINKSATMADVEVNGTGAGAASGYVSRVTIGDDYTLTISPEAGYDYTVTATMGGSPVSVIDNDDNTYIVEKVTGKLVFTIDRSVNTDGVAITEYLNLDGTKMWLVINATIVSDGKVPTYDNQNMFWSEQYNTYCYIVIADTLDKETVVNNISIGTGTSVVITYDKDVNKTGRVDASDAQLVYNMYNAVYGEFTTDATMEKFLKADTNNDKIINVNDAVAIISGILN